MNAQLEKELNLFETRVQEMAKANFILAEKKLTAVLQAIAQSEFLCKLIGTCTNGFSYEIAFHRYLESAKDGVVYANKVVLPENPAERVALVFALLLELDNGEREFYPFLNEYFPGDGSYFESFHAFMQSVVLPFSGTLLSMAKAVAESPAQREVPAEDVFVKEATMRAIALVKEDQERLYSLKNTETEVLREIGEIANGLIAALETQEAEFIRLTFLGYKYGVKALKKEGNLSKIKKILEGAKLL
ncbi:MAG: hypothetical protein E7363_03435 [Clostridiales bacterium]|nr:hypothetical protein [Clostridiales bacterium]